MFVHNKTPQTVKQGMTGARWDASGTIYTSRKFYLENEVRYPAQILTGLLLYQHKPRKKIQRKIACPEKCAPAEKSQADRRTTHNRLLSKILSRKQGQIPRQNVYRTFVIPTQAQKKIQRKIACPEKCKAFPPNSVYLLLNYGLRFSNLSQM